MTCRFKHEDSSGTIDEKEFVKTLYPDEYRLLHLGSEQIAPVDKFPSELCFLVDKARSFTCEVSKATRLQVDFILGTLVVLSAVPRSLWSTSSRHHCFRFSLCPVGSAVHVTGKKDRGSIPLLWNEDRLKGKNVYVKESLLSFPKNLGAK